jgi:hypothetical protein
VAPAVPSPGMPHNGPDNRGKEQEQHGGQWQRLQYDTPDQSQLAHRRQVGFVEIDAHEHEEQCHDRGQRHDRHRQALAVQVLRQQNEERQEDDDENVAPCTHFEQLQRHQKQQERDASLLPGQCAVLHIDGRARRNEQRQHQDPTRQRRLRQRQKRAPDQQQCEHRRSPRRQVFQVRQHDEGDRQQQHQHVAPFTRCARDLRTQKSRERRAVARNARRQVAGVRHRRRHIRPCTRQASRDSVHGARPLSR